MEVNPTLPDRRTQARIASPQSGSLKPIYLWQNLLKHAGPTVLLIALYLATVFFSFIGLAAVPSVAQAAAAGLIAEYAFNEGSGTTVSDSSGNAGAGTIQGATWTPQGKYGSALSFNGTSNWVTVNDSNAMDLTGEMTLEAWVYPTVLPSDWRTVIHKEADRYYLMAGSNSGTPAAGGTFATGNAKVYAPSALAVNTWTHLAVTYDSTWVRLYINGIEVASQPQTALLTTSTGPLRMGGTQAYGEYFQGRIDEVRIYNRALIQAEIQTDMNTPVQ
jgi:hypothetical protein